MSRSSGQPWRPMLRLARRDARRHLARTVLASLLIALPIAAVTGYLAYRFSASTAREQALASLPTGVQARLTATALPREEAPFPQLPEGAPGPWTDDPGVLAATPAEVAKVLSPGAVLNQFWVSPPLIVSAQLGLDPGDQGKAGAGDQLARVDLNQMVTAELTELDGDLALITPEVQQGRLPTARNEVLVSSALADHTSVSIGDSLRFLAGPDNGWRSTEGNTVAAMQDSQRGYRVVGIAAGKTPQAWAPAGWLSELVEAKPLGIQRHWLVTGTEPVTWNQAKALNQLQAFAVSREVLTNYPPPAELYPVAVDPSALLEAAMVVLAGGTVGTLLVLFLVTPAFAVSAEQSRRTLGLAAACGADAKALYRTVLAQGIVLGLAGGGLGALVGVTGAVVFGGVLDSWRDGMGTGMADLGVGSRIAHLPWWVVPVGMAIGVLLGMLAAAMPARTASRLNPVAALKDRRPPARGGSRTRVIPALILGPSALLLAAGLGAVALLAPVAPTPLEDGTGSPAQLAPPSLLALGPLLLALPLAGAGLVFTVIGVVQWLGRRGRHSRPAIRLALRDAADHPSRTVPAALGVLFAVLAASYTVALTASALANDRDSGSTLRWNGTFLVVPSVGVTEDFDRLLSEAGIAAAQAQYPQISGSLPIYSSSLPGEDWLVVFGPEGNTCPAGQLVHVASAVQPGAPLRCVSSLSAAAYNSGIRIGSLATQGETFLFTGEAVRATGISGAEAAAQVLEQGGVIVDNAALLDANGQVRLGLASGPTSDPSQTKNLQLVPGYFLPGLGAPVVVAPQTAHRLGLGSPFYVGELAVVSQPLNESQLWQIYTEAKQGSLVQVNLPDSNRPLMATSDPREAVTVGIPLVGLAGIAILATAVSVLLAATQSRRDEITLQAIGADRGLVQGLSLARAGLIIGLGLPAGLLAGIGLAAYQVAWSRHQEITGAWLRMAPAWGVQAVLAVTVAVAGLLAALLFSRPARRLVRRGLD